MGRTNIESTGAWPIEYPSFGFNTILLENGFKDIFPELFLPGL